MPVTIHSGQTMQIANLIEMVTEASVTVTGNVVALVDVSYNDPPDHFYFSGYVGRLQVPFVAEIKDSAIYSGRIGSHPSLVMAPKGQINRSHVTENTLLKFIGLCLDSTGIEMEAKLPVTKDSEYTMNVNTDVQIDSFGDGFKLVSL